MDSKTKKKCILLAAVLAAMMLIPMRSVYRDGGTVRYRAFAYHVTQWNALKIEDNRNGRYIGTEVSVLGLTVYNSAEFVPDEIEHVMSPAS